MFLSLRIQGNLNLPLTLPAGLFDFERVQNGCGPAQKRPFVHMDTDPVLGSRGGGLGVCSGGWEAELGEHSGIELLCLVCLCSDTIGHDHLG